MNNYQTAQTYGGIGGTMPYGYAPQTNQNPPKYCQPLTAEEIATLQNNRDSFSLGLTQEEMLRAICFHRDNQKRETIKENPVDGTVTCLLCGETFYPCLDLDQESVSKAVSDILDVLQTTKLLYLDMPEEAAREFYQIIALIKKIPTLYKIASDNFVKHENWATMKYNYGPSTAQLYNQITGSFGFGGTPQPQPMPTAPYGFAAQPQQPMYGAPAMNMPMSNGFGYNGPAPMMQQGYMPNTAGYQYTPGMMPQPAVVDPAAAPATETPAAPAVNQQFEK